MSRVSLPPSNTNIMAQNKQDIYHGNLRFIILASTYIIYLAFGGIVLSDSEWKQELNANKRFDDTKKRFLANHPTLSSHDLDQFLNEIKAAVQKGVKINGNRTYNPNWNFGGGVLYAASLLTTIGEILFIEIRTKNGFQRTSLGFG